MEAVTLVITRHQKDLIVRALEAHSQFFLGQTANEQAIFKKLVAAMSKSKHASTIDLKSICEQNNSQNS